MKPERIVLKRGSVTLTHQKVDKTFVSICEFGLVIFVLRKTNPGRIYDRHIVSHIAI
jgi:hypothetical protein